MNESSTRNLSGVSVIMCTTRQNNLKFSIENFVRQDFPHKELIIILNKNDMEIAEYTKEARNHDNISVFQLDENTSLGECFEFGLKIARFDYIAKFDDDDFYGSKYLTQVMDTFNRIQCDVVGKSCYFVYFTKSKKLVLCEENPENIFIHHVSDATLVFKRNVLENIIIPHLNKAGTFTQIQRQLQQNGVRFYSTDRYNFVVQRNPNPQTEHTWHVTEKEFLNYSSVQLIAENVTNFIPYTESK